MYSKIAFARAETCMVMEPRHSNIMGNVHGGELMKLMDNVAGIAAFKHCKGDAVTARVDEIVFIKPVHIGDIVTCVGQLTYVGRSSMQIMVSIYVNDLHSEEMPEASLTAEKRSMKKSRPSLVGKARKHENSPVGPQESEVITWAVFTGP